MTNNFYSTGMQNTIGVCEKTMFRISKPSPCITPIEVAAN